MRTQSILMINPGKSQNIAFGDGNMPDTFGPYEAMKRLKNKGYILKGNDNKAAFAELYDRVNDSFESLVKSKKGVYQENYTPSWNSEPDFVVNKWPLSKEKFTNILTRFWSQNKGIKDVDAAVTNFLVNTEGMKKPGFFQRFSARFAEYCNLESVLKDVTNIFLKSGQHGLK